MTYSRIVQYGNITETFDYEKDIKPHRKKYKSSLTKKRQAELRKLAGYKRTAFSIKRAKRNFFRLCHANNCKAQSIHFFTLTLAHDANYSDCLRYIYIFFNKLKKYVSSVSDSQISYIGVPELTKKGRYHFHLLIYNLPTRIAGDPIFIRKYSRKLKQYYLQPTTTERFTRNLQRLWGRGFLDVCPTTGVTAGIAGYMAKYMGKFLANPTNEAKRAYNCSRNVEKIRSYGSKSLVDYFEDLVPDKLPERSAEYQVPFLGTCKFKRFQV